MNKKLKIGIALGIMFVFSSWAMAVTETCSTDSTNRPVSCYCCMVGPSGPTPEPKMYTKLLSGESEVEACKRCGNDLAGTDGVCAVESFSLPSGCSSEN